MSIRSACYETLVIRQIYTYPAPVLKEVAQDVSDIDGVVAKTIDDMVETMYAAPGVGLAAPQVGIPLRLFVYNWRDEEGVLHRGTAINPQLLVSPPPLGEPDVDDDSEGCLSIPGERFPLLRGDDGTPRPADVEFAVRNGRITLLQIRPFNESQSARESQYLRALDARISDDGGRRVALDAAPRE